MRKALLTIAILVAPRVALACPVCFGASDSPLAAAINMGVIMMLGVVAVMLGSFGAFFVYLNRRAKLIADDAIDTGTYASGRGAVRVPGTNPQEGTASC
jgi:hypothetical protein